MSKKEDGDSNSSQWKTAQDSLVKAMNDFQSLSDEDTEPTENSKARTNSFLPPEKRAELLQELREKIEDL